ncbi:MAG: hypothetical protein R2744_06230 [Bacteroidales bacterium]
MVAQSISSGAILAILINTFMMSFVFWLSSMIGRKTGRLTAYISLVAAWLTYEQLTMLIPVLSPWLNPGNVFGNTPALVQWYEYTGSAGGSLWISLFSYNYPDGRSKKSGGREAVDSIFRAGHSYIPGSGRILTR